MKTSFNRKLVLRPDELRRHAQILEERVRQGEFDNYSPHKEQAKVYAEYLWAVADKRDLQRKIENSGIAETAEIHWRYPIIGEVVTEGGKIKSIEYPWTLAEEFKSKGGMIVFDIITSPVIEEGRVVYIWIGTEKDGPRVFWSDEGWTRIKSHGNYGNNWASGGTFSKIEVFNSLKEADPELYNKISSLMGKDLPDTWMVPHVCLFEED